MVIGVGMTDVAYTSHVRIYWVYVIKFREIREPHKTVYCLGKSQGRILRKIGNLKFSYFMTWETLTGVNYAIFDVFNLLPSLIIALKVRIVAVGTFCCISKATRPGHRRCMYFGRCGWDGNRNKGRVCRLAMALKTNLRRDRSHISSAVRVVPVTGITN
jgi:hypothetical protein